MSAFVKKVLGMKEALKEKLLQADEEGVPVNSQEDDNSEE